MTDYFSSIPSEIQESIIEELRDELPTLFSCSLVQRSWVSAAKTHILKPTIISQFSHQERSRDNATEFLTLCHSPHSTILPAIKFVVLNIQDASILKEVTDELAKASPLRKVVFLDHGHTEEGLRKLQQLSDIEDFAYNPVHDFGFGEKEVRLITSFPHLRTLSIYLRESVRDIAFPLPLPQETGCFKHLRTLRLALFDPEPLLRWLLDHHPEIALEKLDLRILCPPHRGWGSVSALNAFLESQARTLTDLSLSVKYMYDGKNRTVPVYETINLGPLTNLRALSIITHDARCVRDSLATISPKMESLKHLTVGYLGWKSGYGECDCEDVAESMRILGDATAAKGPLTNTFLYLRMVRYAWRYMGDSFEDRQDKETLTIGVLSSPDQQVDSRQYLLRYSLNKEDVWRAVYY
ncbi:hypothetical protein MD484_g2286, partial [Candolleomyces efflorescens]